MKTISIIALVILLANVVAASGATPVSRVAASGAQYWYVADPNTGALSRTISGDGASAHFDVVLIGDGYDQTDADQERFTTAAETFTARLFTVAPYADVRECINVTVVNLVSQESGIDDPDQTLVRSTALDCSFVTGSMEIIGDVAKAEEACSLIGLAFDVIYVIVNDSKSHDGSWADYSTGIAFSSDAYAWGTVVAHELGHLVARLADEYRASDCGACACPGACPDDDFRRYTAPWAPEEPNVTTESDPAMVPWKDIMQTEAFPTTIDKVCDGNTIGRWEGGDRVCFGIYRPREYCLMDGVTGDDPLVDDFCPVCSRAIVATLTTYYACGP